MLQVGLQLDSCSELQNLIYVPEFRNMIIIQHFLLTCTTEDKENMFLFFVQFCIAVGVISSFNPFGHCVHTCMHNFDDILNETKTRNKRNMRADII